MQTFIGGFFTLTVVVVICGTVLYGCDQASQRYYQAQKECIDAGGNWMPMSRGNDSYVAQCLRLK